jgi:hypothetical protein
MNEPGVRESLPAAGRAKANQRVRLALAATWVVAMMVATTTALPTLPPIGIDSSWMLGIMAAFQRHLNFGTDVIWTYGPYGWLNLPFVFDTPLSRLAIVANLLANLTFLSLLAAFLWTRRSSPLLWLAVAVILGGLVDWSIYVSFDNSIIFAAILLLVFALTSPRGRRQLAAAVGAGALLGLVSLVKGTDLIVSVLLLAIATTYGLFFKSSRPAAPPIAAVATFVALWVVAGDSVTSITAYLRGIFEISSGYTAGMSRVHSYPFILESAVMILVLLAVAAFFAFIFRERSALLLLLCLAVAFVAYKEAFVRFSHLGYFYFVLIILCVLAPEILSSLPSRPRITAVFRPAWWALTWFTIGVMAVSVQSPFLLAPRSPTVSAYATAVESAFSSSSRDQQQANIRTAIRQHYNLPPDMVASLRDGDVDVIPWDIALVYGYQLNWNPRPVLQSYGAYTPYLDNADAAHLSSPQGARYVLYYYDSLDGEYPLYVSPAAFRALLEHYVPLDTSGPLELQRRPEPVSGYATDLGRACAGVGDWISVPDAGPARFAYANVDIPYSLAGILLNVLYRPAELRITFRYGDGLISPEFRLIPRIAGDGMLMTGYAANLGELADLFQGRVDNPISAFKVTVFGRQGDYTGHVCSTFVSRPAPAGSS